MHIACPIYVRFINTNIEIDILYCLPPSPILFIYWCNILYINHFTYSLWYVNVYLHTYEIQKCIYIYT